ncbi:MAG TPA: YoaK family protein, partial [Roseateles sp.]|nr:YoaK family protein [Roseateles sp.]
MPVDYLARLTAPRRSPRSNLHLGAGLAFVAGALNAGGFLAVGQYTSHMTGMVSSATDHIALGQLSLALGALLAVLAFVAGALSTAWLVNFSRRRHPIWAYVPPLLLEASLLLAFGLVGSQLLPHAIERVSLTALLLCYVMGLQNALITKISNAEIRTTHVTGLLTDLGLELGRLLYWNRSPGRAKVVANRRKLRIHISLVLAFFVGGLAGALGFKHAGFIATVPLACGLVALAAA